MPIPSTRTAHRACTAAATGAVALALSLGLAGPAHAAASATRSTASATALAARPVPLPAQVRDQVHLTLRDARNDRQHGPAAAGFRHIPGTPVSTDLPSRLEIGSDSIELTFRTSVSGSTADYDNPLGLVVLADASEDEDAPLPVATGFHLTPGQTGFTGLLAFNTGAIEVLGKGYWATGITENGDSDHFRVQEAAVPVVIKLHSLLGQQVTRSGDTVTVFGSAKAYAGDEEYTPRVGQKVAVQRYTANGWQNVLVTRTDSHGHINARIHLPYRAALRITTADTDTTFGATTTQTVL